ncbi:MAG: hypothetical protein GC181_00480 [Bacteroidetes bacterium]|nr:hypothetical protein [Bacteroidota bacterium]
MIIRKILLVLVGYLLVRFFYGIWKFRNSVIRQMKEMQNQGSGSKDGEVHISASKGSARKFEKNDEGTYVDYEEVE